MCHYLEHGTVESSHVALDSRVMTVLHFSPMAAVESFRYIENGHYETNGGNKSAEAEDRDWHDVGFGEYWLLSQFHDT